MDEKNLKKVTVDSRKNQKLSSPQVKLRTLMLEPHGGLTQTPQPKSPRLCQALWVGSGGTWEKPRLKTGELGGEAQAHGQEEPPAQVTWQLTWAVAVFHLQRENNLPLAWSV